MTDTINHPAHYTTGNIEVIDFIEDKNLSYCRGNIIKYVVRAGIKDPATEVEDLKKARWYIDREIKEVEARGAEVRASCEGCIYWDKDDPCLSRRGYIEGLCWCRVKNGYTCYQCEKWEAE